MEKSKQLSNATKKVAEEVAQEEEKKEIQEMFHLDEINSMDAEVILKECVTKKYLYKKYCKICGGKRNLGRDIHNSVEPCYRCVNMVEVKSKWHDYCLNKPELMRFYFNEEFEKNENKENN